MATLEQKIKALLEGVDPAALNEKETIKTKGGTTIVDDDEDKEPDDDEKGGASDEDEDDEGGSDEGKDVDGKTAVSKDLGAEDDEQDGEDSAAPAAGDPKKDPKEDDDIDNPKVNEDIDPFHSKFNAATFDETGIDGSASGKTAKTKVGLGRKDGTGAVGSIGKLPTGGSDGAANADNSKIKARLNGGSAAKVADGKTSTGGQEPTNARNHVDKNPQGAGPDPFGGLKKNEHMDALFAGEELSEEFMSKAETIFEAAVAAASEERVQQIQEEVQQQITEAVEEVKSELVEQIDGFLNLMVEQWIDDNAVALEGSMKVELSNSFIDGLKVLFKEHYFDIPEDKIDVIEEQANEIAELQQSAQEAIEAANALQEELVSLKRAAILEKVGGELTTIEQEKFAGLAEKIAFTSDDEFAEKLNTIKESYFPKVSSGSPIPQDDTPAALTEEVQKKVETYVDAIAKNLRF